MSRSFAFKIGLLTLFSFFMLLILQYCCNKEPREHYIINSINPSLSKGIDSNLRSCAEVNSLPGDTIWIHLNEQGALVASNKLEKKSYFISEAKAKSPCPPKPEKIKGLKHHLKSVEIKLKSDTTYNKTDDVTLKGRSKKKSVNEWLKKENNVFPECVQVTKFNTDDTLFLASVKFTFQNGDFVNGVTDTFVWKHN